MGAAHRAGYAPPVSIATNAMERALSAVVLRLGIYELVRVGPTQRHTFSELTESWSQAAAGAVNRILQTPPPTPAAPPSPPAAAPQPAAAAAAGKAQLTTASALPGDAALPRDETGLGPVGFVIRGA